MKHVTLDPDGRLPLKSRIKEIEPGRLGYLLFSSGKYRQAVQKFREALKKTPEDSLVHFIMGLCLYDIKEYNESVDAFRNTLALVGPDNSDYRKAWSHIWIGHILDIEGKRKEAIEEYEHAIATENRTSVQFGQYDIDSDAVTWAKQRIKEPFARTLVKNPMQQTKRNDRSSPLGLLRLRQVCENPLQDLYYQSCRASSL